VVRSRLKVFYKQTAPLIDYYDEKHMLSRIAAERSGAQHSLLEDLEQAVGISE
jgi:adenylate kinase family enzyme